MVNGMRKRSKTRRNRGLNSYLDEVRDRQRNTVWPDTLRHSRAVDEFLWRGSSTAPLVQRIGALVFALAYVLAGAGLGAVLFDRREYGLLPVAALAWLIAGRVLMNAVRNKRGSTGE